MPNRGRAYSILDQIRFVMGNVVLDNAGEYWAVYRLGGITYHHLPRTEKFDEFNALESLFASLAHRIKILSLVRNYEQELLVPRLKALYQSTPGMADSRQLWDEVADEIGDSVDNMAPYDRDFFVCLQLRPRTESPMQAIQAAARKLNILLRKITRTPQTFQLQELRDSRGEAARAEGMFGSLSVEPASAREIQWLIMRGPYRAVGEPPLLDYWQPKYISDVPGATDPLEYYEPNLTDIRGLVGDIPWESQLGQLTFYHGGGRQSHQKFLSVSSIPSGDPFPDREWLMRQLPVDECIDITVIPSTVSEKQRETKARNLRGQQKHVVESDDVVDFELAEAEAEDKMMQILHAQGKPRLLSYITVGVAATRQDDLDTLVEATRKELKGYRVELANDWGSQVEAFTDLSLPAGPRRLSDYPQHVSSLAISGGMPHGRFTLGDGRGFIIGKPLANNGLVNWDISYPMMHKDQSGATAFVGTLGGGKTVNMNFTCALAGCAGIPSIIFDPKGDSEKFDNIEELRGGVKKIRMGEREMQQMPIFKLFPPEKADKVEGLVTDTLIQLMGVDNDLEGSRVMRQVIRACVSEYIATTHIEDWLPSGLRRTFEKYARDNENSRRTEPAEEVVEQLKIFANHKLTHTIFSDKAHEGYAVHEQEIRDPVTLIQTWDLPLPKPGAQNITDQEKIGNVVLSVIAAYAIELAGEYRLADNKPVKIITFDECWRLFATATGQDLIHGLIREGRSQNLVPIIATQQWNDIPDDIMAMLEVMFMFKQSDRAEIERGLSAMGMDAADEELVTKVMSYESGMCLHRDVFNNVGAMKWEIKPEKWFYDLKTTATNAREEREIVA